MFQEVVESRAPDEESRRAYTSLMMKVVGERDIGACEVCNLLHGIPLLHCTRTFIKLVIRLDDYVAINVRDSSDNENISFIQFYKGRPAHLENITLFGFAKKKFEGKE